jgi:hypothetical protein
MIRIGGENGEIRETLPNAVLPHTMANGLMDIHKD